MEKVKALGYKIKLDTNGSNPEKLKELLARGLVDYVAMDIKNDPARYSETAGVPVNLQDIEQSIEIIKQSGKGYEFRTTVAKGLHRRENISALAEWISPCEKYFLQNFVDSGDLIGDGCSSLSEEELKEMKTCATNFIDNAQIRGF